MAKREITSGVFNVGAIDWQRRLFDELIPLPDGTSYNAYLIKGEEKTALIDTVDPEKENELFANLEEAGCKKIDYIIASHAEQDHSGTIPKVLERFPQAKVLANPKCKSFLSDLLHIEEGKFREIKEGERISLGGKTLEFIYTPWVHWPETMSTYLLEDKILFSCDFFGSHRATSETFVQDEYKTVEDAKRYYAEIMMPFRKMIAANLEKIAKKQISFIAPSHGPVYQNPDLIINAYKEWISDKTEKKIIIPYVSMHQSTKAIVDFLTDAFMKEKIKVLPLNLIGVDLGKLSMELVEARGILFAGPYVLAGLHPALVSAAYLTSILRPKAKLVSLVCSYGWGGRGKDQFKDLFKNLPCNLKEPLLIKGRPKKEDFELLKEFAHEISQNLNS